MFTPQKGGSAALPPTPEGPQHGEDYHDGLRAPDSPEQIAFEQSFKIRHAIGRGGFGEVKEIRLKRTGEIFAMKKARKKRGSLNGEWEVLSHVHWEFPNANIVYPLGKWDFEDGIALILPRMKQSLEGQRLDREDAGRVCNEISLALKDLLAVGYIHFDVHPGNFLVDASGRAFLSDFGHARHVLEISLSDLPEAAGGFLADEVLSNSAQLSQLDKADIFGLTMALAALCCGGRFQQEDKNRMKLCREQFLKECGVWTEDEVRNAYVVSGLSQDPSARPCAPTHF